MSGMISSANKDGTYDVMFSGGRGEEKKVRQMHT